MRYRGNAGLNKIAQPGLTHRPPRLPSLVSLLILALTAVSVAKVMHATDIRDVGHRLIGHPKARFPLTIYAEAAPAAVLNSAVQDAVAQWNQVFEKVFHRPAFTWTASEARADILIRFDKPVHAAHEMGETGVDTDKHGVIGLPVKIDLNPPGTRGATDSRQMLFDVTAHELGHALGLPHINQPSSIMCCEPGAINFNNPATRTAYVAARRHPDLSLAAPYLAAHYRKFWQENGS
ncbi:MAG: matrixin family metalloprotease [Deltaproteobacteria bacterium]|nr:matrixin family metalloprotease [Deltaproteobacteria bacterium]